MTTTTGAHVRVAVRWNHLHDAGNRGIRAAWRLLDRIWEKE